MTERLVESKMIPHALQLAILPHEDSISAVTKLRNPSPCHTMVVLCRIGNQVQLRDLEQEGLASLKPTTCSRLVRIALTVRM